MSRAHLEKLSISDQNLLATVDNLLDQGKAAQAAMLTVDRMVRPMSPGKGDAVLINAFAGFLIDAGSQLSSEQLVQAGLLLLENWEGELRELGHDSAYEYNRANGHSSLYSLQTRANRRWPVPSNVRELMYSKNWYWKGYKSLLADGRSPAHAFPQLTINLGNSLRTCGRMAEAIKLHSDVLRYHPEMPQALVNRAWSLEQLAEISNSFSVNLWQQVYGAYTTALDSSTINYSFEVSARAGQERAQKVLADLDASSMMPSHDAHLTLEESSRHTALRSFAIENTLALNEHALYCACTRAERDELSIAHKEELRELDFVADAEICLGMVKREFGIARQMLFDALESDLRHWEETDRTIRNSLRVTGEATDVQTDLLRVVFKTCFGMLDKIARGICDLYGLAKPGANIYFTSFWKPNGKQNSPRWKRVNRVQNWALTSLYTLATDLSERNGEWGDLRKWRHVLEHELFSVRHDWAVGLSADDETNVGIGEFTERTMHLMQLTASAIICFCFTVRYEAHRTVNNETYPGPHQFVRRGE